MLLNFKIFRRTSIKDILFLFTLSQSIQKKKLFKHGPCASMSSCVAHKYIRRHTHASSKGAANTNIHHIDENNYNYNSNMMITQHCLSYYYCSSYRLSPIAFLYFYLHRLDWGSVDRQQINSCRPLLIILETTVRTKFMSWQPMQM